MLLRLLVAGSFAYASACGGPTPSSSPTEAPPPAEEATSAEAEPAATPSATPAAVEEDFLFERYRSSGPVFVDQLTVRADGQLLWVAPPGAGGHARLLEARATPEEVAAVRRAVADGRFFDLDPQHTDPGIADGSQAVYRVTAAGRTHRVDCDNATPPGVETIERAVAALLTEARRAALDASPEAQPEDFDPSLRAP